MNKHNEVITFLNYTVRLSCINNSQINYPKMNMVPYLQFEFVQLQLIC